jgi:hypothetical protein
MRYLEAKRLAAQMENKRLPGPPENKTDAEEWDANMSPEAYIARWPNGPKAELARKVLNA